MKLGKPGPDGLLPPYRRSLAFTTLSGTPKLPSAAAPAAPGHNGSDGR